MSTTTAVIASNEVPLRSKLPIKTMMFYGMGQTGVQIFRDTPAALLPVFMTTMLGVSPWLAGLVVLVSKIWVIVCDPVMGAISDQCKPRYSRRPFLIFGAITTSLLFTLLFSFSNFSSPWLAALVIGALFFIASTAFSTFSVPYLAIASELSNDPHERTTALSFRMVFTVLAVVLGIGLAQPLVFKLGGDAAAWQIVGVVFGVICLISMLSTSFGVPKSYGKINDKSAFDFFKRFSVVKENKPFLVMTLTYLVQSIAQASGYAVVGFVFIYAVGDINLLFPFILVMATGSILSQPMWLKISRAFGKIRAFWFACVGWMCITVTWFWVSPGSDVFATLPMLGEVSTEKMLVLARAFLIGVTNSGFSLLSFSLLTDTIESFTAKNASADEGIFSGLFTAAEKFSFAIGPLLAGAIMSFTGFESSIGGVVDQNDSAINGIVMCYSLVPAFVMALSLVVFTRYRNPLAENN